MGLEKLIMELEERGRLEARGCAKGTKIEMKLEHGVQLYRACIRGVPVVFSPDIRLVVQEKFAHLGMTVPARQMKGSIAAAKYGIRKIDHGAGGAGAIGSARVCKRESYSPSVSRTEPAFAI